MWNIIRVVLRWKNIHLINQNQLIKGGSILRNNRFPAKFREVNMLRYDHILENKGGSMRRNVRLYQPGKTFYAHFSGVNIVQNIHYGITAYAAFLSTLLITQTLIDLSLKHLIDSSTEFLLEKLFGRKTREKSTWVTKYKKWLNRSITL